MIPRSITLRGFLCYKEEQVIDLDGCDLWVLSGRNGSGKSAIFDAMTFALFKAHRGGKQEAASLIHAEADSLAVCFEFDLGPDRYRIQRTVPRSGAADRCVYRCEMRSDGSEHWPAVPETHAEKGLERWVQDQIGLTHQTFTASVLLLQGEAENLVRATPKKRFEILAGIVDLDRYRHLHEKADNRRHRARGQAEALKAQLQGMTPVEPTGIEQAEVQWNEAERVLAEAEAEWRRLVDLKPQSTLWVSLKGCREAETRKRDQAREVLVRSEEISRDWRRLQTLDVLLPALRDAMDRRASIQRDEAEVRSAEDEQRALARQLDLVQEFSKDNQRHLDGIDEEITRDESRRRDILKRQKELAIPMHRASQAREHRLEVSRLEAKVTTFPQDLDVTVRELQRAHDLRTSWKSALPSLKVLVRERKALADALARALATQKAIESTACAQESVKSTLVGLRNEESYAREAEGQAREQATASATLALQARERLERFEALDGATECDRCGQSLTVEHFAVELARLRHERDRAAEAAKRTQADHHASKNRLTEAEAARAEAEGRLRQAENAHSSAQRDLDQRNRDAERHTTACLDVYERLDTSFRTRVAPEPPEDWLSTEFPEESDLAEGQRLSGEVEQYTTHLQNERERLDALLKAKAWLDQALGLLDSVALQPGDEAADAENAALQAEDEALGRCLEGHAKQRELAEQTLRNLIETDKELKEGLRTIEKTLSTALGRLDGLRNEADRARASAGEDWRDALDSSTESDLKAWEDERRFLVSRDVKAQAETIPQAQIQLRQTDSELDRLEREIVEIPEPARRDPQEIARLADEADASRQRASQERQDRHDALGALCQARAQRLELENRSRAADRDRAIAERLSHLLGPRGLQRDLIRDAERGIVAFANPILREVSGGELELELIEASDDEPDHALNLEVIVRTHGAPRRLNVAFLSGSQKFRVAVSLALAIGQYARGSKERPIESVIIDEGFGSLDRQGRDEMIDQLRALRGRLARIVLVSHQEEFAEAFPDGYRFEVIDGSTVVRPFHR